MNKHREVLEEELKRAHRPDREPGEFDHAIAYAISAIDELESLKKYSEATYKDFIKAKKEIARLSQEVNDLDHGIHKHQDPHWKLWETVLRDKDNEIARTKDDLNRMIKEANKQRLAEGMIGRTVTYEDRLL